jgi:transcriptional regulator with XRE-family HTH domain
MSKPFSTLLEKMPEARRKRIAARASRLKKEMALRELRQALDLTQTQLAEAMNMKQAAVSKFERQSDLYLSTLRNILCAMGADLKIIARFPEGDVQINQFDEIRSEARYAGADETHTPVSPGRAAEVSCPA